MIRFPFNEKKTAQAAAHLLNAGNGTMPYMSLIKLLYLADRHTLIEIGQPITGDRYVSMKNGPVLSRVLDIIHAGEDRARFGHEWLERVSAPEAYTVKSRMEVPDDSELSDYEVGVLDQVYAKYGHLDRWDLVDFTHTLPEWTETTSSVSIDPADILRAACKSQKDIERIAAEAETQRFLANITG